MTDPRPGAGRGGHLAGPPDLAALHDRVLRWYADAARDLPWRQPDTTPWGVFVSEVMAQQTPLARVEPVWRDWLARWPTPAALAADSPGEAVRAWGRLGYPRRALRLHEAAVTIVARHGGDVPSSVEQLRALPGVGGYTAAAVACFAYGIAEPVVDTNVRRVLARVVSGAPYPAASLTRADLDLAARALPLVAATATVWNVAVMELGALVCMARAPDCARCPVAELCAWNLAGRPAHVGPRRRAQTWAGTDRQARGALLAVVRDTPGPVAHTRLARAWPEEGQRLRCLDSLVADGLVEPVDQGRFALPGRPGPVVARPARAGQGS